MSLELANYGQLQQIQLGRLLWGLFVRSMRMLAWPGICSSPRILGILEFWWLRLCALFASFLGTSARGEGLDTPKLQMTALSYINYSAGTILSRHPVCSINFSVRVKPIFKRRLGLVW